MKVTDNELKKIKKIIFECIKNWQTIKNPNPFLFVDNQLWGMIAKQMPKKLSDCDFTYNIHNAWVKDWNYIDRKIPMDVFLKTWTTDENIRNAINNA